MIYYEQHKNGNRKQHKNGKCNYKIILRMFYTHFQNDNKIMKKLIINYSKSCLKIIRLDDGLLSGS